MFLRPVTTRKDTPSRSEGQQEPGDRRNTATDYMAVTTAVSITTQAILIIHSKKRSIVYPH